MPNQPLTVPGRIGTLPLTLLIDTGSSLTLINSHVFHQLHPRLKRSRRTPPPSLTLQLANQSSIYMQSQLQVPITIHNTTHWHLVYVVPDLWRPCIIGNNFIRSHNLHIDGFHQRVHFGPPPRPKLSPHHYLKQHVTHQGIRTSPANTSPPAQLLHITDTADTQPVAAPDFSDSTLQAPQQQQLLDLLRSFPHVFTHKPGRTTLMKHQITLQPNSRPRNQAPCRYSPARRLIIEDNIKEMLQEGVIVPSKSPCASPVVLAPKKDGSMRFCIDYRKLNDVTVRDAYPIPRIDDTLDALQHAHFVSTLDLRSGYWQVAMEPSSRALTAFVTHKGLFECTVMPFGLTKAPATFQRLMDIVLSGLKWQCCLVYLDDIIVFSTTFDQHLHNLRQVFSALADAHLTLKASKCNFSRQEMKFLGHLITPDGIKPDPDLIATVQRFPVPRDVRSVQAFLGLTGYYRRFILYYAKIAELLFKLLRTKSNPSTYRTFNWNEFCTTAFEILKKHLTSPPIMQAPIFSYPFILELDACEYGIGCVLSQEYDNKISVIAYASRTLNPAERKYSAVEREAFAIVWATKHFRQYLEGGPVIVRTDCKALQWLKTARDPTG
ncbi:unnamed protein product [Rotaria magnacalcarata]|uniref:Reverse transcriptase domain-containing protein n=1 Tax=Rotaria magnacalcarata TaxID=392030 RepID=A0A817AJX3_9BILA|nr:unnamed protein product [Rotaria magnacalcarata]